MPNSSRDPWLSVELRHLVALAAVAQEGSFGAAADRLGYVQSAISQQIAFLEERVGARLFDRSRGASPVKLTVAGRVLLDHANEIVAQLGAARTDLAALQDERAGMVRVGLAPSIEARLIPVVLPLARRADIELLVRTCHDDGLCLAQLAAGELDAAIVSQPQPDGPFVGRRLLDDPYMLLVPSESSLARRKSPPTAPELAALTLVVRQAATDARAAHDQLTALGIEPVSAYRSDDNATIHALVAAGVGAAILPALSLDPNAAEVTALSLVGLLTPRRLTLVTHARRFGRAAVERFCEQTVAAFRLIEAAMHEWLGTGPRVGARAGAVQTAFD